MLDWYSVQIAAGESRERKRREGRVSTVDGLMYRGRTHGTLLSVSRRERRKRERKRKKLREKEGEEVFLQ